VNAAIVFGVIAVVQGIFLLLLVLFLAVRRRYDQQQRAAFVAGQVGLSEPMRRWIVAGLHPEPVVEALRALPRGTAVGYVSLLARQTIPASQRDELAVALRHEPWMRRAIAQRRSRFWWRRLEAARALSLVGTEREREMVASLLNDSHPAVQIAASEALPRVADLALLNTVLENIFAMPRVVRHYVTTILRQSQGLAAEALAARIRTGGSMVELEAWIDLAGALDDPQAIAAALTHVEHPAAPVRRSVARALGRFAGPDAARALATLVRDTDPWVRAHSARSLGQLGSPAAVSLVAPLLHDPVWQVRLRGAVALAQLGERGRAALRAAREGDDRFARDMATMVSGLSDGAVHELGDA
jgi:HEAT repeat protein